jgi:hypothetical protein
MDRPSGCLHSGFYIVRHGCHSERQPDKETIGTFKKYLFADWWSKSKFPFVLRNSYSEYAMVHEPSRLFSVLVREHRDMNDLYSRICRTTNYESRLFSVLVRERL